MRSAADDAFLFEADAFETAVVVLSAFRRDFLALDVWIAAEAARAAAHGDVIRRRAGRAAAASAADRTRVDAAALDAGLLGRTVRRRAAAVDAAFVGADLAERALAVERAFRRRFDAFTKRSRITYNKEDNKRIISKLRARNHLNYR